MSTTYTPTAARELANALDSDPIAASQIKEYLSAERLIELLEIQLPEPPEPDEPCISDFRDKEIVSEVINRDLQDEVLEECSDNDLMLELVARKVTLETITAFYRRKA